jgi:GGDEF domain-containing protein
VILELPRKAIVQSLAPGGLLLLAFVVLLHSGWAVLTPSGLIFLFYAALALGMLLAWRFHSSRVFLALITLFLARQAILLISPAPAHSAYGGLSRIALEVIAFLVPLNFVLLSLASEHGFRFSDLKPAGLVLFVESVVVMVLSRVSVQAAPPAPHAHHAAAFFSLPAYVWTGLAVAAIILLARFFLFRKPVESGLLWSLCAFSLAIHFLTTARISAGSFAVAPLILAISIVGTSYLLAYHDELTSLPSRRAFNDALARLQSPYSIAMVDIDHFKKFNDTYGHDTGDQVLRLVAAKLARVSGGGEAYRCGGEEFAILFSGKNTAEVLDHLEQLRTTIEAASFRNRGIDRRQSPRGPDRRNRGRIRTGHAIRELSKAEAPQDLSVTVSIGVATSAKEETDPNRVVQIADKALYRAKAAGRNRVETDATSRRRSSAKTAEIA